VCGLRGKNHAKSTLVRGRGRVRVRIRVRGRVRARVYP